MPEICHREAAVRAKIPILVSVVFVYLISLSSLVAAFILGWTGKSSVIPFLVTCAFLAIIGAVIGTKGRLSLSELTSFIRCLRRAS